MRQPGFSVKRAGLTACFLVVLLATAGTATAQEAERPLPPPVAPEDALTDALTEGELTEAEYTLERARSIFHLARVRHEFGDVERPSGHDATLILRDLAARVDDLSGADRKAAERLLARPPTGSGGVPIGNGWTVAESASSPACGATVCVHWVDTMGNADAPAPTNVSPANGRPDWVDLTLATWEYVWSQEIGVLDYRAPLSDATSPHNGGGGKLDVYLDDLGMDGVFGYCTSDDPNAADPDIYAVSAFCVVDNDFSPLQYGTEHTPREFLEVTSAHEFHHASQFAYDWLDDYWLIEGTAANMEENVYPNVNDNVSFLDFWSPLSRPGSPLDRGGLGDAEYGAWIFWRFLQEKIGGDPSIVREIWERADAAVTGVSPDNYSLQAVKNELAERGLVFRDVFAQFGTANRLLEYADAETAGYPEPPRTAAYGVGPNNRVIGWKSWKINHLATRFFSFSPGSTASPSANLRIEVRLPANGTRATLVTVFSNDTTLTRQLNQNANGYVRTGVQFGRGTVRRIEVVLSNGSTRIGSCWLFPGPPSTSCFGRPLDDGRVFQLRAQLLP